MIRVVDDEILWFKNVTFQLFQTCSAHVTFYYLVSQYSFHAIWAECVGHANYF